METIRINTEICFILCKNTSVTYYELFKGFKVNGYTWYIFGHFNKRDHFCHYENMPIQIYWKFYHQKWKFSEKNSDIFSYFCSKHRLWVLVRIYVFEHIWEKNNVYPCKPQFYCIKVGVNGVKIIWACFRNDFLVFFPLNHPHAGLGGSVGCAIGLETRGSRVQPPPRLATFFRGDWSWNIF